MHNFTVPLEHHVYDMLVDTCVHRNPKPQPYIIVDIQTFSGFDDTYVNSVSSTFPSIADTGCQSCLTGIIVVHRLEHRESHN